MLSQGINLMLYGMGTVFVFLTLLVLCTMAMSTVAARFFDAVTDRAPSGAEPTGRQMPSQKLISVIEAAIARHRSK